MATKSVPRASLCCFLLFVFHAAFSQNQTSPADSIDYTGLTRETQRQIRESGYAGLIWWTPTQFWVAAAERTGLPAEKAGERYAPLAKYTIVLVAVGKVGIGNVNWFSGPEIRDAVKLRDSEGNLYNGFEKVSPDAEGFEATLKPVLARLMGPMGQNVQMLFFPGVNKMAHPIADPLHEGSFSVVISNLLGSKESSYDWQLPLTSLSPPKYCPIGKEKMEANWKFCPWHGVPLDGKTPSATPPVRN